jgi:hypothetical protein
MTEEIRNYKEPIATLRQSQIIAGKINEIHRNGKPYNSLADMARIRELTAEMEKLKKDGR